MIDIDKWQEIFDSIWRHKLRTFLTALGVGWGIFTLVLMLGAINGLTNSFEYSFSDDSVNSLWIWRGVTSKDYKGLNKGRRIRFDNQDFDYIQNTFSEITEMTGRFYLSGDQMLKYGEKAFPYPVRGVHPGHKLLENTEMLNGRYLNEVDMKEKRKVIVIGKVIKENLFGKDDAIGKVITAGDITYKVIGVFYDSGGENEMSRAYIPMSTAQTIYAEGNHMHQIMVDGGDLSLEEMNELENDIFAVLAARKGFDPTDRRAIRINNRAEDYQEFASLFTAFNVLTWIIGFFSIMAGVISVSNIMLIIVKDRTKEIGIRKALGATPGSIVAMILQESILITTVAGYFGMVIGVSIIYAVSGAESEYFRHPTVNLSVIIMATLTLIVSGALAGLIPAMKAANINPVTAIKSD